MFVEKKLYKNFWREPVRKFHLFEIKFSTTVMYAK